MARDKDQKESQVALYKVDAITLSVMSADEARKQSVTIIDDPIIYQDNGDPKSKGINDDRLGTMDMDRICKTCMGSQVDCPGHFGHIELNRPVFHANLLDYIRKVLKAVCYNCSHLLSDDESHKVELKSYAEISNAKSRFTRV
jgi:DNA-directed RNA polymerase II subunit RPB1